MGSVPLGYIFSSDDYTQISKDFCGILLPNFYPALFWQALSYFLPPKADYLCSLKPKLRGWGLGRWEEKEQETEREKEQSELEFSLCSCLGTLPPHRPFQSGDLHLVLIVILAFRGGHNHTVPMLTKL